MAQREAGYCPYLGLPQDHNSFFVYATPIHRCHRAPEPIAIHPDDQEAYCLSPNHVNCPRFSDPQAKLAPPTAGRTEDAYARYGWESTLGSDNGQRPAGRVLAISLAAVTLLAALVLVFANQARIRRALQSGWQPPSGQPTLSATFPGGAMVGPGTPTPTPFSTWTPTPSPQPTATETPTVTPTFTITPTPTDIPTGTPTPTNTPVPTPTATPPPLYVPRSPVRYEPNCERTAVQGVVYDAYGNLVSGQTLKLWNEFGYESIATTETAGQGQGGEGYYEFYLYPGPYESTERFNLAVVDQTTGAVISPQLVVEFTPDRCQPNEGGRQVAIVDWVYSP